MSESEKPTRGQLEQYEAIAAAGGPGMPRLQRWTIEALGRLNDALDRSAAEASALTRRLVVYTRWLIALSVALVVLGLMQLLGVQLHLDLQFAPPPTFAGDASTWWTIAFAIAGTVSQIAGSRLSERGTPPDDPWASMRGDDYLSQEPAIRAQGKRWRDRAWGTALGLTGTMLLVDSVMAALFSLRLPKFTAWVLIASPLCVAAWSLWTAWRQSQQSITREDKAVDYLHSHGKA